MNIVFASVVTRDLFDEYRLFRESFRTYHRSEPRSVVHCDRATYDALRAMPDTVAIPVVGEVARPISQWSGEFRSIVRHKMLAMADAWRLFGPDAVAWIDCDMVATARFMQMVGAFTASLTLSPHFWGSDAERRSETYGFYNSGLILSRDPSFAEWWLEIFDRQPDTFADQRCLNDAPARFDTMHFTECWNVGYWRRRGRTDVPPVPEDTVTFHAHVFARARAENEFEVGQKHFVSTALSMLDRRGAEEDRELLGKIVEIAQTSDDADLAALEKITQNYRHANAYCCSV